METTNNNMEKNLNLSTIQSQESQNSVSQEQKTQETASDIVQRKLQSGAGLNQLQDIRKEAEKAASDSQQKKEQENRKEEITSEQIYEKILELLNKEFTEDIKEQIETLKRIYYKKFNQQKEEQRDNFIKEGKDPNDFEFKPSEIDKKIKNLLDRYKHIKEEYLQKQEIQMQRNLEKKKEIIKKIEELTTKQEKLNKTFEEFRTLQKEWRETGLVPQHEAKKIQEKYIFVVEKFYDWVKLNKEMRDLDLKKNLEKKIELCQKAENLLLEPKIVKAYKELQKLHQQWKEIGPVPKDKKEEVWQRFKKASNIINKRHYDYFQNLRKEQEGNLRAKTLLCEEAEKIAQGEYKTTKEWQEKTNEIIELQKIWRLIGFAPKKYNNSIYQRFRKACDQFFDKKRAFFDNYTELLEKNLQLKLDLIAQAESLKESTEWKKTTELCIELQKKWKEIGPVSRDKKDEIWNRFVNACNHFFDRKREYFRKLKEQEEENLKKKEKVIQQIKKIDTSDPEKALKELQELENKWTQIGFVPLKEKNRIQREYNTAVKDKMTALNIKNIKTETSNQALIDKILKSPNPKQALRREIEHTRNRISRIERDVVQLENNMSFFEKSKNAESILDNFKEKITRQKNQIENLQAQLKELIKAYKSIEEK